MQEDGWDLPLLPPCVQGEGEVVWLAGLLSLSLWAGGAAWFFLGLRQQPPPSVYEVPVCPCGLSLHPHVWQCYSCRLLQLKAASVWGPHTGVSLLFSSSTQSCQTLGPPLRPGSFPPLLHAQGRMPIGCRTKASLASLGLGLARSRCPEIPAAVCGMLWVEWVRRKGIAMQPRPRWSRCARHDPRLDLSPERSSD